MMSAIHMAMTRVSARSLGVNWRSMIDRDPSKQLAAGGHRLRSTRWLSNRFGSTTLSLSVKVSQTQSSTSWRTISCSQSSDEAFIEVMVYGNFTNRDVKID